ncbi:biotin--[acetyl-CoA-carboxylase] ligase [Labilibacter marinus]|uniref:biotin--[acetyl-CoA-carboxylase] ligase n=1 Tax=Labilibacter marinus TaxID=1477105 RepID=UPI00094F6C0E|nr:biotin--[acetyl-CoA-carboxylase] ligase [Labilibacter marinus]
MSSLDQFKIYKYEQLASTNNKLKELKLTSDLNEYAIVQTDNQTAGKGQAGNSWESEKGKNLTFSLYIKPNYVEIQDQFIISKAVALGIISVFNSYKEGFKIKWPNDIYYHNKKVGGILIENALCQSEISESVIGIGLNINQTNFISDAPNPISIKSILNKTMNLDEILVRILASIIEQIEKIKAGKDIELDDLYMKHLYRNVGLHAYKDENGKFEASINGINNYGHLELKTPDGTIRSYAFKEVEFLLNLDIDN